MDLAEALKDSAPEFEDRTLWERGTDAHYRQQKKRIRILWPTLSNEWLCLRPAYQTCVECLKVDVFIGPHLDRLVGTSMSGFRLETDYILKSLIHAMIDDEGRLVFTSEKFQSKWEEFGSFFRKSQIVSKTIAPIPNLLISSSPLQLNDEIVLDCFTDDEVNRGYQVGVIRPHSIRIPIIYESITVGIRRTTFIPKTIQQDNELPALIAAENEGSFGNRPPSRGDLLIDDILSALRLFKHTQIRTAGFASWTDSPLLDAGATSYKVLGQWPYFGKFELSEGEIPHFLELWRLLEQEAARFSFSIHRFNLAFDRGLLADRIVDLIIAAEALFLSDLDDKYRGELRFRFALRAAKFIEHPSYGEQDIFRIMRQAYDARSAIVHGGSPKETHLPDDQSADLPHFTDALEELVRLGLRKALSMKEDGKKLRQAAYWDALLLSKSNL